jgi:hypothetical protein
LAGGASAGMLGAGAVLVLPGAFRAGGFQSSSKMLPPYDGVHDNKTIIAMIHPSLFRKRPANHTSLVDMRRREQVRIRAGAKV